MLRHALRALCTTMVCAAALGTVHAQTPANQATTTTAPQTSPTPSPAPPANPEVVGSVNGKEITWSQLLERMQKTNPDGFEQAIGQALGTQVADQLFGPTPQAQVTVTKEQALAAIRKQPPTTIVNELNFMLRDEAVAQEAAKAGITLTDAQVDARIAKVLGDARTNGMIPATQTDDQFLTSRHYTRARLRADIRTQMTALDLIRKDQEKAAGHPFGPEDFVQARHILIATKENAPNTKPVDAKKIDTDAEAKITKIAADIKSGKITFEAAAKQYSEDPGTKEKGGDLGVFTHGMMVKEFDNTAFSLKPGEISKPIKTQFGYHLIQVTKLGKDIPAADRDALLERSEQGQYGQYLQNLMTQKDKVVNNLQPSTPVGMVPGGRPGGARPIAPGVRPGQ